MPKASHLQARFNGGEVSPIFLGNVDADRYKAAVKTCLNFVPMIQGGLTRRPGTMMIEEVKTSSKKTRTVRFQFSTTQAYIIEFGDLYVRFYMDYGQILNLGTPVEVVTPFVEADLFNLRFTQSADVLYITHPTYAPRKLTRTSHIAWTLTTISFLDGPYLPPNTSATTITPSAATGSGTLTASASLWATTDVGRLVSIGGGASRTWYLITAYTSATIVTATNKGIAGGTAATTNWRLGIWSDTTGWPAVSTFHEDRLFFSGATSFQQRLDGSVSSDYENFAPFDSTGAVVDDRALSFTLNSTDVNVVRWMISQERGMLVGTAGGEWLVASSFTGTALTPTTISAKQMTNYGSANIQANVVGKGTMFVQRAGRKVREMSYYFTADSYKSPDRTTIAEHITGTSGIKEIALQKEPQQILWAVRNDGVLAGMTYEQDEESLIVAWHRQILGGVSDALGNSALVESAAVIPSPDGTRDDLWLVVNRRINGATKRYIEVVTQLFDDAVEQKDAFFVDSGLTYDNPLAISAITKANPGSLTSNSHGLSNGDKILISDVGGMTELNSNSYLVANSATNTFTLTDLQGNAINTTSFETYISGGFVRKYVITIAGIDHLEGQMVDILADGAVQPSKVVSSGSVTLSQKATTVHIGLGFNTDGELLRLEAGSANGTALGKTRRINRVAFLLYRSLGLKIGPNFDDLQELTFRTAADPLSRAPALFTGLLSDNINFDYDMDNNLCFRQSQPLPCTILAIAVHQDTQDRI